MARAAQAIIDLQALRANYTLAKQQAPKSVAYAVIKANAYGHGLLPVAKALADQVDGFAVACVEEATALRDGGIKQAIMVLEGVMEACEYKAVAELGLEFCIHNTQQLAWLNASLEQQPELCSVKTHIKVDSGMHRLGFSIEAVRSVVDELTRLGFVDIQLMSHFACADEAGHPMNASQLENMKGLSSLNLPMGLCNSAALLAQPQSVFQMVRPGIMIFGASPLLDKSAQQLGLAPVMTLQSNVIAIHDIKAGESVGYGQGFVADNDCTIAVVAIGYGDGYPRAAKNGTPVLINGELWPLAGRVSMDMITVDISAPLGATKGLDTPVQLGDTATLWGQGLSADVVAQHCDTIAYELFCQVTNRVHKHYQN